MQPEIRGTIKSVSLPITEKPQDARERSESIIRDYDKFAGLSEDVANLKLQPVLENF